MGLVFRFAKSLLVLPLLSVGVQQVSTTPHDRLNEEWWKDRHESCVRMTKYGRADVAFLGDSITQGWENTGEDVWDTEIAPFKCANFGFGGDRTDHVLWRLENGELIGMHPKLVVLMIGTNNIGQGENAQDTADGVRAVVKYLTDNLPRSKVLLLGIFPRADKPDDPLRVGVNQATQLFKTSADGRRVQFLDIGDYYLQPDGSLLANTFPDQLHPDDDGYRLWATAIIPTMKQMLGRR